MSTTNKNWSRILLITTVLSTNFVAGHAAPRGKTTKPATAKSAPALKAKPHYIVGRVSDSAGKPLSGVEVGIYGTTVAGANTRFEAETNEQGLYSQRLPEGIYGATASLKKRFNDHNYNFTVPPTDGITAKKHDSSEGIVKNFVWRINGLKPGETPGKEGTHTEPAKYFGGHIFLKSKVEGFGGDRVYFPNGSTLEITMTPHGPLIDGSEGVTKTFRRTFDKDITNDISWYLTDIPIGLYILSAQLLEPLGAKKSLGVRNLTANGVKDEYAPTAAIDFEPTQFGDMQMMQVMIEP